MKRIVIFLSAMLCLLMLVGFATQVNAFDAISAGGAGWLLQHDATSEAAYYVGFAAPIVQKQESGYSLLSETTYLYSTFSDKLNVIREYAVNKKIITGGANYDLHFCLGAGAWKFLGDEGDSETLGAFLSRVGFTWNMFSLQVNAELVQQQGPDLIFISSGLAFNF